MKPVVCIRQTNHLNNLEVDVSTKRTGLGKGLEALIQEATPGVGDMHESRTRDDVAAATLHVSQALIDRNPWQPRQEFGEEALDDLVRSVQEMGILQPLLVRPKGEDRYELIAGERRLTAARRAGMDSVPVIVRHFDDREALEVALVENLQRENLNPIEEAEGYQQLSEQFGLTQEQIAKRVGKGRATITNTMRLLKLNDGVKAMVFRDQLSPGHAKILLGVDNLDEQETLAQKVVKEGLSVRALEKIMARRNIPVKEVVRSNDIPDSHVQYLTERLQHHFKTAVSLSSCGEQSNGRRVKGVLSLEYYSNEDLDRLMRQMGLPDES
ncbi:MAG: ParB/RepB/Spo0J family partition protein [Spartobacteria bacterium]|nr:ParB/RepB/Spo0J family partition protein [Spartobacteria bacterium]